MNTVEVSGGDNDTNPNNDMAVETTMVSGGADLSVDMTASTNQITLGQTVTFTAVVFNDGPSAADGAQLLFRTPTDLMIERTSIDGAGGCTGIPGLQRCSLPGLENGATRTVTFVTTPSSPGTLTAIGSAVADSPDPMPNNNDDSVNVTVTAAIDLLIEKTSLFDTAVAGRDFDFDLAVGNQGGAPAPNVIVTDTLPSGVMFVEATTAEGTTCEHEAGLVTCTIPMLGAGVTEMIGIKIAVDPSTRGTIANLAVVTGTENDPVPENNESTLEITVVQRGDLNGDGLLNASDIMALILEFNDGDGENIEDVAGGTFRGNFAFDVNEDFLVTFADYILLAQLLFGIDPEEGG